MGWVPTGEVAQWLITLTAFSEDSGLIFSAHMVSNSHL